MHERAHARSCEPLNVEFYRQSGSAAVLTGQNGRAADSYRKAGEAVRDVEDDWWVAHASERPLSVLDADWDLAGRALDAVRSARPDGLEAAIATTWASAAALSCASPAANDWAEGLLARSSALLGRFPHQAELSHLLGAGSRLRFSRQENEDAARLRRAWVKWVLYRVA